MRIAFLAVLLALRCNLIHGGQISDKSDPQPGVSRELARWRSAHYSNVHYLLRVEIAPGADKLSGSEEIRVTLDEAAGDLVLDWRHATGDASRQAAARNVEVNGQAVTDAREINDHLLIPSRHLKKGENVLRLTFESPISTSGSSAVTRYLDREDGSEYVYTLFVPSDASTAFPCFDQPDLKARFRLEMTVPAEWTVVSNTAATDVQSGEARNTKRVHFRETEPISTYLFAFAAGPFAELRDETSSDPGRLFVRKSQMARARRELPDVLRLNRQAVSFFAKYFDYPFPFSKYDLVLIPEFAYGGMEHAGATFFREEGILFPSEPSAPDRLRRAGTIFHEAAHQWFGDLVTMRWFDDLWLKEGFANFMAAKATEAVLPEYHAWNNFHVTKAAAYRTDVTKGTTPIWQEIANLSAAKSAYGSIVYSKAPAILRQAEFFLGPDAFQQAIQLLLKAHAYGNAEWGDLVRAFERTSGAKLDRWADAWVKRRGMPNVRILWSADRRGQIDRFVIRQQDVLREGGIWPMRVKLFLGYEGAASDTMTVMLGGKETAVPAVVGKPRPAFVFANYEDYGYGLFLLDEQSKATILKRLGTVQDDFLRALLWEALWEHVREAHLAPSAYIELGIKWAANERDEVTVQSILARMLAAFNRYLSDDQRRQVAPRLEQMIFSQMTGAEALGLRITYFRALVSTAMTEEGRTWLKKLLAGTLEVPGMRLSSRDRFDIIRGLMAKDDANAPELLEAQRQADTTDNGRRYAFAAGAARAEGAVKGTYFGRYLKDTELAERWIEDSLPAFNTVHQSELTLRFLEPALQQVPRWKAERSIFFVNTWLAAFIGGQKSPQALAIVRRFLRYQSLEPDLRLKVLEVMDDLERCVRIRARFTNN